MNSFTSQKFWLTIGRSDVNVKISMVHCQGLHLKFSAWLTSTLFIWLMLTLNCDSIQNWMMLMMLWIWITALLLTDACFDAGQKTFHWRDSTSHYVWPTQTNKSQNLNWEIIWLSTVLIISIRGVGASR